MEKEEKYDVIDLDIDIVNFILPRLKQFENETFTHPAGIDPQEWHDILKTIIAGLELYQYDMTRASNEKITLALSLLFKHFRSLWE
jgi:hypothetical protein